MARPIGREQGTLARIARRGVAASTRLERHRRLVERTFAHLNQMRRLAVRYEKRADVCRALLAPDRALLAFDRLARLC